MSKRPHVRVPAGMADPGTICASQEVQRRLPTDLETLWEVVAALDRLDERLARSPIPKAITARGYFTPDEDDRVRQGVLLYRNCRLAAYDIILRYRNYAELEPPACQLRCFLLAFGAALVLYAKSLKIIAFAEHVPMLRAKINEPDTKYEMEAGFFDDVLAGYSRICNYRSLLQADMFWRLRRGQAHALAREAGGRWSWLVDLIRHQRHAVRQGLLHVLAKRLRHDWRAFGQTILSPFRQARHGLEHLLGDRLADAQIGGDRASAITSEVLLRLRQQLQPGDVLLSRKEGRLTAAILPGFWTHAALFLGKRTDLEDLGLRSHPHVARHWHEIPADSAPLGLVIEALFPCVQLSPLQKCLEVDHLTVLRAPLPSGEIASAIGEALGQLGKPYDFEFDFNNSSRIVCTELIYRSFHSRGPLKFTLTKRLGRFTLTGDDIVAQTLEGATATSQTDGFQPVALLLKTQQGRPQAVAPEQIQPVLRRIRDGWRPVTSLEAGT